MNPNTRQTLDSLAAVLRKETDTASMMEELIRRKQRSFIQWHTGELESVVVEEEGIISALTILEKERIALVKMLSRSQQRLLTMKEILALYPDAELARAYADLQTVSARVMRFNHQNRQLVQSSLSFVRRTMGFITGNFRYRLLDQKV